MTKRTLSIPWHLVFALTAVVAVILGAKLQMVTRVLDSTYRYDCTVKAVDANTFAQLKVVGVNGPPMNERDLLKQSFAFAPTPEGNLRLAGIAYQPREFGIAVEGYSARAFTVTPDTRGEIEVLMTRLPVPVVAVK